MNEKKKICFVIPSLIAGGGSERVIVELANFCADKTQYESHLIILAKAKKFYTVSKNVIVHEPDFDHKKYSRLVFTFKLMHYLRATVKSVRPDAVLSFEEMYSSFVIMATLFLKFRIFVSDRSKPDKDWGFFHNNLRKILYRFAHGIIAQTEFSKLFLTSLTKNKNIIVIPNPIKSISTSNEKIERENIILTVGRLIKSKKHDLLIKMFAETDHKNWKLIIVGDGPQMVYLKSLSDQLGLNDKIIFTGDIVHVEEFYLKSKIFAFTSVSEGFPNALGEAMSAGLACISFDCVAGPSDLIDNGFNGFLITEEDVDEYQKKLIYLMENTSAQTTFGIKAREKMKALSIDNIGPQYLNFLLR